MFCPKCGFSLKDDAVFCAKCGSPLNRQAPNYNQQQTYAPGPGTPGHWQTQAYTPSKRNNPIAKQFEGKNPFAIMKLVGIVVLAVSLFLPWFRISIDPLIDAANGQILQTGVYYQMPKLGDLGISVLSFGDTLNQTGQLYDWMTQTALLTNSSSQMARFTSLQAVGTASWAYRIFGLAWIASIIMLIVGATMSLIAKKGDKLLIIAVIICTITSVAGIAIALFANGQISAAMALILRDSSIGALSSLAGSGSAATLLNNLFGFTFAPIVAILSSTAIFIGSKFDKCAKNA